MLKVRQFKPNRYIRTVKKVDSPGDTMAGLQQKATEEIRLFIPSSHPPFTGCFCRTLWAWHLHFIEIKAVTWRRIQAIVGAICESFVLCGQVATFEAISLIKVVHRHNRLPPQMH